MLLNSNCDLKICDFGLARAVDDNQGSGPLTEYVVTRWYRAPEIMLACKEYTKAVDVWSVGCIFGELLLRSPLFAGEDYIAQLRLICDKLGKPAERDLDFVSSDRARRFMLALPNKSAVPMEEIFPKYRNEANALDLVKKMLDFHPQKRISIEECLNHPFVSSLHNAEDEPSAKTTFAFAFDNQELTSPQVQDLIWEEIKSFHPEIPQLNPSARKRPLK